MARCFVRLVRATLSAARRMRIANAAPESAEAETEEIVVSATRSEFRSINRRRV